MASTASPRAAASFSPRKAARIEEVPLLVKKLSPDAVLPERGSQHAAGYDLSRRVARAPLPPPLLKPNTGGRRMHCGDLRRHKLALPGRSCARNLNAPQLGRLRGARARQGAGPHQPGHQGAQRDLRPHRTAVRPGVEGAGGTAVRDA
jgi:hypothetical protein